MYLIMSEAIMEIDLVVNEEKKNRIDKKKMFVIDLWCSVERSTVLD